MLVKYQCPSDSRLSICNKSDLILGRGSAPSRDLVLEKEEFEAAVFQLCSDSQQVGLNLFSSVLLRAVVHEEQTCSTAQKQNRDLLLDPAPHPESSPAV